VAGSGRGGLRTWRAPDLAGSGLGGPRTWRAPDLAGSGLGGPRTWRAPAVAGSGLGGPRPWWAPDLAGSGRGGPRPWWAPGRLGFFERRAGPGDPRRADWGIKVRSAAGCSRRISAFSPWPFRQAAARPRAVEDVVAGGRAGPRGGFRLTLAGGRAGPRGGFRLTLAGGRAGPRGSFRPTVDIFSHLYTGRSRAAVAHV
jgi:hypothetical protein